MAEMKDPPPKIQKLLKKKRWTWPPDEQLKAQFREATEQIVGSVHMDADILEEIHHDLGRSNHARRKT